MRTSWPSSTVPVVRMNTRVVVFAGDRVALLGLAPWRGCERSRRQQRDRRCGDQSREGELRGRRTEHLALLSDRGPGIDRERALHEFVASRTTIVVLCRPQQQFH